MTNMRPIMKLFIPYLFCAILLPSNKGVNVNEVHFISMSSLFADPGHYRILDRSETDEKEIRLVPAHTKKGHAHAPLLFLHRKTGSMPGLFACKACQIEPATEVRTINPTGQPVAGHASGISIQLQPVINRASGLSPPVLTA